MLKPNFPIDSYNQVIGNYQFPITDLQTAVKFLDSLPHYCNVDLPDDFKFDNLYSAEESNSEFNLTVLSKNCALSESKCRIHVVFKEIRILEIKGYRFVVICSGPCSVNSDCDNAMDKYVANGDVVIVNPSIHDVYEVVKFKLS